MGNYPTFSFMPWPYQSTEWFVISPFQVVCGTWDFVETREVPVSWEKSWHEMCAAKRTQKYNKDDIVKDEKFLSCHIHILEWICTL